MLVGVRWGPSLCNTEALMQNHFSPWPLLSYKLQDLILVRYGLYKQPQETSSLPHLPLPFGIFSQVDQV